MDVPEKNITFVVYIQEPGKAPDLRGAYMYEGRAMEKAESLRKDNPFVFVQETELDTQLPP